MLSVLLTDAGALRLHLFFRSAAKEAMGLTVLKYWGSGLSRAISDACGMPE